VEATRHRRLSRDVDKVRRNIMRLLKVQGKGHVSIEPDMVTVSFDVETKVKDYEECLRTLNMRAEDLRQSMITSGLETRLKTSSFKSFAGPAGVERHLAELL
jgi:uncharacterized protein YggE